MEICIIDRRSVTVHVPSNNSVDNILFFCFLICHLFLFWFSSFDSSLENKLNQCYNKNLWKFLNFKLSTRSLNDEIRLIGTIFVRNKAVKPYTNRKYTNSHILANIFSIMEIMKFCYLCFDRTKDVYPVVDETFMQKFINLSPGNITVSVLKM